MPTSAEQSAVVSLVNKVKGALQKIASNPDQSASMVLEEFREVGSFRKETMLAGHNVADIVVVFRSLPTFEAVSALGQKIVEDLKAGDKEGSIVADITFAPPPSRGMCYGCCFHF
ncbi:unnamed protein product [Anisakis simplex]|uniref:Interleukin enhancer-binding factor 2 (inferred by orthology to a human protein) n=1 Tax=Anisakis simplex TaxID=6269 RepID=A0A0M3J5E8_ANISI|nr:unnamed protein product [Anisakis simplex]